MPREAREAGVGHVAAARPLRDGIEVDLDERSYVLPAMPDHHRLGDVGARAKQILDERRRQGLAARGDDEIARAVDDPQYPVLQLAHVSRPQPTLRREELPRRFGSVPVTLDHVLTADQDLVVCAELELPAADDRADIARPGEGALLAGDDRPGFLGLAVDLAEVDAPDLPQRRDRGRKRRAARERELELVEAELVEQRSEDQ